APDASGACIPVGVQGCAARFVDSDGMCRPSVSKCEKGTIPDFLHGCSPVGIPQCDATFLGDDGVCHVSMAKCPSGTFAVPQKGCVPIDGPDGCGTSTWGAIPDGAGVVYVDPTASASGADGSKAKPFVTLAAALAAAPASGRVALAAGTYHEAVRVNQPVEIDGRCPSMVRVDGVGSTHAFPATVYVQSAFVTLRGLTVGGDAVGVFVEGAPPVTLDRVVIDGALDFGVLVNTPTGGPAASVVVTNSLVRGTRAGTASSPGGVFSTDGATATLRDSAVYENVFEGVLVGLESAELELTDVLVEGTTSNAARQGGNGIVVAASGKATLDAVAVVGNRASGAEISDFDAEIDASNSVFEGTLPYDDDQNGGFGLQVGGTLHLDGSVVAGNHTGGLTIAYHATKPGSAVITKSLVTGTLAQASSGLFGRGIDVQQGASLVISDSTLFENREIGLLSNLAGSSVTATRVLVEDTLPRDADGQYGVGLAVDAVAALHLDSVVVRGGHVAGVLLADDAACDVTASGIFGVQTGDFTFQGMQMVNAGVGDGITSTLQSTLTVTSTRIDGCARAGILFDDSQGQVTGSSSTDNEYGVDVDGTSDPAIDDRSSFDGNAKGGRVGTKLTVPDLPAAVPM
ncbi:MAG TPA: right-handed parallel beta-helix repeat-containing protein, partial [Minicystis sp.]|nr:right-handed parallel beta-helix repeat-containing protein [Minicystis sp.]